MIKKSFPIKHLPYRRRRGNGCNWSHGRNWRDGPHGIYRRRRHGGDRGSRDDNHGRTRHGRRRHKQRYPAGGYLGFCHPAGCNGRNGRDRSHGPHRRNGRDRSHRRDGCNGNDACGAGLERLHDSFHPYYLRFRH